MAQSAHLSWTASTDTVDGYNVYRGNHAAPGGEGATPINGTTLITGTTFVDSTIGPGTYDYFVTAIKGGSESLHSNEVTAVLLPSPPTNLAVVVS